MPHLEEFRTEGATKITDSEGFTIADIVEVLPLKN